MKNLYIRIRDLKSSFNTKEKPFILKILKQNKLKFYFNFLIIKTKQAVSSFSKIEWYLFLIFIFILFISTVGILQNINKSFMVEVPLDGGSITEGIIGTPRFINPVLASSDIDRDLVSLIYSGLMRKNYDGNLIPDLAEKYEISENGLIYTFTLKDNIYFHNETPITADDIIFTINKIKDTVVKSPKKGDWDGVNVEKTDDKTIKFTLRKPYASFLENTTIGIIPLNLWSDVHFELNEANTNPIGSGPYKIDKINKNKKSGGIINSYELIQFKKFSLGKPYIKKIKIKFYSTEGELIDAILNKEVDQISSISPENTSKLTEKGYKIEYATLPRIFGVFFNQNQNNLFTDKKIVEALDLVIDKDRIVREVLLGYGVAIDSPIPPNMINYQKLNTQNILTYEEKLKKAEEILNKSGWKKNKEGFLEKTSIDNKTKKKTTQLLEFSISTGNAKELSDSAEFIKKDLESLGVKVDVKTFEIGNLNQSVIRPRKYDALLFGQIINHESDLFAFWHSSQRNDPGINVAMYTNTKVDKILEEAFVTIDEKTRIKKYAQFEDEIKKDMPAVFLYSPNFIYIGLKDIKGLSIEHITSPRDRFLNSYLWYTETDNIWKIFSKN